MNQCVNLKMCGSRKYPYPLQGWSLEIAKGRGVLKAKIFFKGRYETKLKFPEGWGHLNQNTILAGSMNIFWNNTIMDDDGSHADMQQYILNSKLEASTKELKVSTFHNVFFLNRNSIIKHTVMMK